MKPTVGQLVKGLVDPRQYVGGMPTNDNLGVAVIDVSCSTQVTSGSPWSGIVLWRPRRGYDCLFVGQPVTVPWADSRMTVGNVLHPFFVPDRTYTLRPTPAVEANFSVARMAAGMISVESSTTSGGTVPLNGTISALAVNDIRDLPTWSATDVEAYAVTTKDYISRACVADGAVAIVGCDVSSTLMPATMRLARQAGVEAFESYGIGSVVPESLIWFSAVCSLTAYTMQFNGQPGTPYAVPDILNMPLTNLEPFANGQVRLRIQTSAANGTGIAHGNAVYTSFGGGIYVTSEHSCVMPAAGGTFEMIADIMTPAGFTFLGFALVPHYNGAPGAYAVDAIQAVMKWEDVYSPSNIGSERVIFIDGISPDQLVTIQMRGAIEGVPSGVTAPLLRVTPDAEFGNVATVDLIGSLFNSPSYPFLRRVYTKKQWDTMTNGQGTVQNLLTASAVPTSIAEQAHAAGFLEELGSKAGSVLGGIATEALSSIFGAAGNRKRRRQDASMVGFNSAGMIGFNQGEE